MPWQFSQFSRNKNMKTKHISIRSENAQTLFSDGVVCGLEVVGVMPVVLFVGGSGGNGGGVVCGEEIVGVMVVVVR